MGAATADADRPAGGAAIDTAVAVAAVAAGALDGRVFEAPRLVRADRGATTGAGAATTAAVAAALGLASSFSFSMPLKLKRTGNTFGRTAGL